MKTPLKSILILLILLFICQTGFAAQLPSSGPVTIYITATSPKGQLLALSTSDLSIQENKQPAHIDRVDCGKPEPLLLAILIDTSGSRIGDRNLIAHYDALKNFLASTLGKGDTAYLVSFADQPHQLTPPTADLTILNAALDELSPVPPKGRTAVYDTVEMASKQNLAVDHVRRVILMIGDVGDNASKIDVSKASSAALESRSTLFVMMDQNDSPPQVRNHTLEEEGSVEDLLKVAREAGGQTLTIESPTGFPAALDIIHNILNHSCRVEYTPASPVDSKPLIRLSVKIVKGHAILFAPQARPARTPAAPTAHN